MTPQREKAAVARPLKRAEFEIRFANRDAQKGWRDLLATARNATVEAWQHLTAHPLERSARCYPLRADFADVAVGSERLAQWQFKVTDGGRIWFCVSATTTGAKVAGIVYLTRCDPGHPKQTE